MRRFCSFMITLDINWSSNTLISTTERCSGQSAGCPYYRRKLYHPRWFILPNVESRLKVDTSIECCLYFNHTLFRGNRVTKMSSYDLSAFDSPNFPPLVKGEKSIYITKCKLTPGIQWELTLSSIGMTLSDKRLWENLELIKVGELLHITVIFVLINVLHM